MDIMDSSDTPTGGLSQTTSSSSSSSAALPLSVDQRDDFASPTNRNYAGSEPTSSGSHSFSTGGSAFDRVDAANRLESDMPTSTDDVMMPHIEYASHPSLVGGSSPMADDAVDSGSSSAASAKAKASDMADKAKAKAADLKDKASDMTDNAKVKASSMADNAKSKAADTADSLKDKLEEGAEKVKEGGHRLLDMAKSGLHTAEAKLKSAEQMAEDKYEHAKDEFNSSRESHESTRPQVQSTKRPEATDTHPEASSMRDAHTHTPLSSLPSHGNEIHPSKDPLMTDVHHSALVAGEAAHARAVANQAQAERDDPLQKGGFLHRMHDKLEDGAEAIKDRVDGFMERNVRTEGDGEHLSAADRKDLPTLIDSSHEHNVDQVRAKMHPSQER